MNHASIECKTKARKSKSKICAYCKLRFLDPPQPKKRPPIFDKLREGSTGSPGDIQGDSRGMGGGGEGRAGEGDQNSNTVIEPTF